MLYRLLFWICAATLATAFCPPHARGRLRLVDQLRLTTEDEVIALVEKAENLWAKVEKLRNEANELSIQAEALGQEAEDCTSDVVKSLKESISEQKLEEANQAQNSVIDLGTLVEKAMRLTEEADQVEVLAEEALAASERALEQHLIDFSDQSPQT